MMMDITINGQAIDSQDVCALWQALYAVKLRAIAGELPEEIEVRSPVTNQRTRFRSSDTKALDAELERLRTACDAQCGKRRHFAISGRFY